MSPIAAREADARSRWNPAMGATVAIPDLDAAERRGDHDGMVGVGEQLLAMAPALPDLRARVAGAYGARAARHLAAGRAELAMLDQRRADELSAR